MDGPAGGEDLPADGRVQQLQGAVIVFLHRADLSGVAVPDVTLDVEFPGLGLEYRTPEAGQIMTHALVHQVQQQLLGQDIDLQGAVAAGAVPEGEQGLLHPAGIIQAEEGHVGVGLHVAGAYGGDVRAGSDVGLIHVLHGDVDDEVAVRQDHVLLADALQIGADPRQGLHLAPVLPDAAHHIVIREGGQQAQAAVLPAQIPVLAGTQVVQQALVVALDGYAHVGHAGVDHAAEDEVDETVASREGDGSGHAGLRQLPQAAALFIGKDDAVQFAFHLDTSLCSLLSIVLGLTVSPAAMAVPGPSTVMPHSSGSQLSGSAPTTAPASTWQFSPRMA